MQQKGTTHRENKSYLVGLLCSVTVEDIKSELSLGNSPSLGSGNVGKLFKIFPSPAGKVLSDLGIETMVQAVQRYVSYDAAFGISQSGYAPCGTVPSLKDCNKHRNIFQINSAKETTI